MLLYVKPAKPKDPKKRSRAACSYCKKKKRKCDETRPTCSRCLEHDQECFYEPVKPRQRRTRESTALCPQPHTNPSSGSDRVTHSLDTQITVERKGDTNDRSFKSVDPRLLAFGEPKSDAQDVDNGDGNVDKIVSRRSITINVSTTTNASTNATAHATSSCSLDMIFPVGAPSPMLEFRSPVIPEFSDETSRCALMDHFGNVLSQLIVFHGENGNPFKKFVLPLCQESEPITNAVCALASAHLEYIEDQGDEKSLYFHNEAIRGLMRLIQPGVGGNRNELLAVIMLLVYYEALFRKGQPDTVNSHLEAAMTVMSNNGTAKDPTGIFLESIFHFYDVIASLSFGTAPWSSAPATNYFAPFPHLDSGGATSPFSSVDTVLGMAVSLWPVIHRLSSLSALKDQIEAAVAHKEAFKAAVLRAELKTLGTAIKAALESWHPVLPANSILNQNPEELSPEQSTERSHLQSIISNALSYRHSAFVYLYRTINSYPPSHPLVQHHAQTSLRYCVGAVSNNGPMSALLWPLFVAACEATTTSDRDLAKQTFVAILRRQGMPNTNRAWTIVQEVWRRVDEAYLLQQQEETMMIVGGSGGDLWRRVSADMRMTIVFG